MLRDRLLRRNPVGGRRQEHLPATIEDAYREFHHTDSARRRVVEVPETPRELFALGRMNEIRYIPFGSTGKPKEIHVHQFGDYGSGHEEFDIEHQPILAADKLDNLYIIRTPFMWIDERGIIA